MTAKKSNIQSSTQKKDKKSAVPVKSFRQKCDDFFHNTKKLFLHLYNKSGTWLTYGFYIFLGYALFKIKSKFEQKTGVSTYEMLKFAESGKESFQLAKYTLENQVIESKYNDDVEKKYSSKYSTDDENFLAEDFDYKPIEDSRSVNEKDEVAKKDGASTELVSASEADKKDVAVKDLVVEQYSAKDCENVALESPKAINEYIGKYITNITDIDDGTKKYIEAELKKCYLKKINTYIDEISSGIIEGVKKDLEKLIAEKVEKYVEDNSIVTGEVQASHQESLVF